MDAGAGAAEARGTGDTVDSAKGEDGVRDTETGLKRRGRHVRSRLQAAGPVTTGTLKTGPATTISRLDPHRPRQTGDVQKKEPADCPRKKNQPTGPLKLRTVSLTLV